MSNPQQPARGDAGNGSSREHVTGAAPEDRPAPGTGSGDSQELAEQVGRALAELGPPDWARLEADVAVTVADAAGVVAFSGGERRVQLEIPTPIVELARSQRESVVRGGGEP
ncbi:hypothetical protein ACQPXH_26700 [Nocardia sp. CA-135953]|uniref:hypothetical protein n=1 Tax=Nocardia sp. CA-135953 TaxID=3239978 RepID=UPI003D9946E5